jgi:hypothetical protein
LIANLGPVVYFDVGGLMDLVGSRGCGAVFQQSNGKSVEMLRGMYAPERN